MLTFQRTVTDRTTPDADASPASTCRAQSAEGEELAALLQRIGRGERDALRMLYTRSAPTDRASPAALGTAVRRASPVTWGDLASTRRAVDSDAAARADGGAGHQRGADGGSPDPNGPTGPMVFKGALIDDTL